LVFILSAYHFLVKYPPTHSNNIDKIKYPLSPQVLKLNYKDF